MGIRFRKSINLGKGFRINMSKTGLGFSWGGKGFRLTKTAKGNIRGTAYIPGTGLSYQKEFKNPLNDFGKNHMKDNKNKEGKTINKKSPIDFKNIQSTALEDVLESRKAERPYKLVGLILSVVGIFLFFINPLFIGLTIIGAILYFYKKNPEPVSLEYDFEEGSKEEYDLSNKLLAGILESDEVFLINDLENDLILDRSPLRLVKGLPNGIDTNVDIISLKADGISISFLPDALLLAKNKDLKAIDYKDLRVDLRAEDFKEEGRVAKDATILEKTYKHTNKDGSPDKRYKDNPEVSLVEYGILQMENSDLNLMIGFSDTVIDGE
ncbi:MAG: DUF4236 domain-containing protein [Anaerococcus sp.]|uniref:DUF4236 domain-containing protein n=1 Tax=Anaerococcus sp. TaxID=1872515 RepID=UPI0025BD820A|nr:DUF4236 domain-containing protein [Anaerococcus sp.]MCI5971443.1 DUF4236 domain-containing protein [Anaerococcus sp.]MDY2927793.1 DUF4236 domain-containing protein [Anaerococcus sp.]